MAEKRQSKGIQGAAEGFVRRLVGRSAAAAAQDKIARELTGPSPKRQTEKDRSEQRLADQVGKEVGPQRGDGKKPRKS
jgi:hypothetical protein